MASVAALQGRVLVKASRGEGLGEARVAVPGLHEGQVWCECMDFSVPGHQLPSPFPIDGGPPECASVQSS